MGFGGTYQPRQRVPPFSKEGRPLLAGRNPAAETCALGGRVVGGRLPESVLLLGCSCSCELPGQHAVCGGEGFEEGVVGRGFLDSKEAFYRIG